ncbi:putative DNA-binding transcriptional regulator YafY [Planomicrobium stackebrandtii]|uniref:DNA-binding transcriptional regulator YafY n=1 Tax=Planomicrobium stackebrandtii TaxID=253160 RepID=A0ABU0GZM1_9BACL|nr:YafY family protein [Planomicrobium stackebrandtii]MDQ0430404.1 putative DNA-binding transcriptional regulator YafY [Planomicrobium stackebrandtii]
MSKTKVLFDLILFVNSKRVFVAQDVANEFGVSIRTAHRYLLELTEMGIPLYTEPGRNGGYRLLHDRVLPPVIFDENEAFSIFFAFQALRNLKSLPFEVNVDSVTRKLYANLPNDAKKKVVRLDEVLLFETKNRNLPSPFLKEIINASAENQLLKIEYYSKTKTTVKDVTPLGVYANDGLWYMPAADVSLGEIRLYRVDRIVSMENTHKNVYTGTDLKSWLRSQHNQESKSSIKLHAELTREGMRQCSGEPWLETHITKVDDDHGYIEATISRTEIEYVSRYFFQLGTSVKIIEPPEIIASICNLSREIIDQYT